MSRFSMITPFRMIAVIAMALIVSACATPPGYDYTAFRASRPKSILVLPPINNTTVINASAVVLSLATRPLAESGYYVVPVSLASDVFADSGLTSPAQIHATSTAWMSQIFGADAALYMSIEHYGDDGLAAEHETKVQLNAKLVDLHTGTTLWQGGSVASSVDNRTNDDLRLGPLVDAVVNQLLNFEADSNYGIAGTASDRLLHAGSKDGLLYGLRSPRYGKE